MEPLAPCPFCGSPLVPLGDGPKVVAVKCLGYACGVRITAADVVAKVKLRAIGKVT